MESILHDARAKGDKTEADVEKLCYSRSQVGQEVVFPILAFYVPVKCKERRYNMFQRPPKKVTPKRSLFNLSFVKNVIYHGVQSLVYEQLVTLIMDLHEHAFVFSPRVEIFYHMYVDYLKHRGVADIKFCVRYTHGGCREVDRRVVATKDPEVLYHTSYSIRCDYRLLPL
jgi:hypothetical protein